MPDLEEDRMKSAALESFRAAEDSRYAYYEKEGMNPVYVANDPEDPRHGKPYVILSRDEPGKIACGWKIRLEDSDKEFIAHPENIISSEIKRVWGDSACTLNVVIDPEPFVFGGHRPADAFTQLDGLLMDEEHALKQQLKRLVELRTEMHKQGHPLDADAIQEYLDIKLPHEVYMPIFNAKLKDAASEAIGKGKIEAIQKKSGKPLYLREFPDYDDTLKRIPGFVDSSYHNDVCPSICKSYFFDGEDSTTPSETVEVYQDYKDPERSESGTYPDGPYNRFVVYHNTPEDNCNDVLETNSWSEAKQAALKLCKLIEKEHGKTVQGR